VTGLSVKTRCVSLLKVARTSKSANSAKLLDARTRFLKLGIEWAIEGWTLETRFLANSSVVILGDKGKFPSTWISLSVKSIESCG